MWFCIVELRCLILESILNCGYVIHHFNAQFLLYASLLMILLAIYLYLFQTREIILDKNQTQAVFLFEFKMGCKAAEKSHSISNAFGPGTANKRTAQWWFKKFYKGNESLEDEQLSGRPLEVDSDQMRGSLKLTLLQLHKKSPRNFSLTILQSFGI